MEEGARGRPLLLGRLEAVLNSLAAAITVPFVVPYAVSLGASPGQAGILVALPLLALNLSQIPAARWGAQSRHPHRYFLVAGGLAPFVWPLISLLMLSGRASFPALLIAVTAAGASSGLLAPVWTSFLAEQVPVEGRGSYFGTRNLLGGLATLAGTGVAAYLVSQSGFARGYGLALLLATLALWAAVGAQVLAVAARGAWRIREPASGHGSGSWRLPAVRRYVGYGSLLILGAGMSTPLYSVLFIQRLHGSPEMAATLIALSSAVAMLAQGLWGRVIDRRGLSAVANGSLAIITAIPLFWLVATDPLHAVPIWLLNGLAWAACNIANLSLVLAISNARNRASVVAWVSVLQAPADFSAPLIGGYLADRIDLPAVFLISALVRLGAWGLFLRGFQAPELTPQRTNLTSQPPFSIREVGRMTPFHGEEGGRGLGWHESGSVESLTPPAPE